MIDLVLLVGLLLIAGGDDQVGTVPGELERTEAFGAEILELSIAVGGTITGEHGVGKIKREWLAREIGPVGLRVHREIKRALDPGNLFNPGSMFDALG